MFIAIAGTVCSGRETLVDYLVSTQRFRRLYLRPHGSAANSDGTDDERAQTGNRRRSGSLKRPSDSVEILRRLEQKWSAVDPLSSPTETSANGLDNLPTTTESNNVSQEGVGFDTPMSCLDQEYDEFDDDPDGNVVFERYEEMLDYVTLRWRRRFVTSDLQDLNSLKAFRKRPFFVLLTVDAPLMMRFERYSALSEQQRAKRQYDGDCSEQKMSLEQFVRMNDASMFGSNTDSTLVEQAQLFSNNTKTASPAASVVTVSSKRSPPSSMAPSASPHSPAINSSTEPANINKLLLAADLVVFNPYADLLSFHRHLDQLDISNPERLRPSWDTYFMLLSELAAHRSNCMKRRVGCILVRNHQIIATGYNGTPKGLRNCNEGGCPRCNAAAPCGTSLDHCLCLHAEENALLEAGRSRLGDLGNCVLYCNTCPCLGCAKKIVQVGISEVVYSQSYGMDHLSARMFREAGVILRQHSPPTLRLDVQPSSHLAI